MLANEWWETADSGSESEREFKKRVRNQNEEYGPGRAAVLNFSGTASYEIYEKRDDFHERLESREFNELLNGKGGRFLIILEDLSRDWIEVLGPRIGVPVSVFALHGANPLHHFLGKARVPLGESPDRHFVLAYRQPVPLEIFSGKKGEIYEISGTAIRTINPRKKRDESSRGIETSDQLVSYWGKTFQSRNLAQQAVPHTCPHSTTVPPSPTQALSSKKPSAGRFLSNGDGVRGEEKEHDSWIAILLVDPCPTASNVQKKARHISINRQEYKRIPSLSQAGNSPCLVSKDNGTPEKSAKYSPKSFFDELVLSDFEHPTSLPSSATYRCRRLVLAKAAAVIDSAIYETLDLTRKASLGVEKNAEFNFDKFDEISWRDTWRGDFFTDLWKLRENLEIVGCTFERNRKVIERIQKLNNGEGMDQQAQDLLEWDNLLEMKNYAFAMMQRTTDSYVQTIQATGAQFANLQARSVNRLTGLASLFFPASLCAAVLAIPSFTGAGDVTKFWIFWAVSVPLAAILGICLMSPIPGWLKKRWKNSRRMQRYGRAISNWFQICRDKSRKRQEDSKQRTGLPTDLQRTSAPTNQQIVMRPRWEMEQQMV